MGIAARIAALRHVPMRIMAGVRSGVSTYRGGTLTRSNASWQPGTSTGDAAERSADPLLNQRQRDLVRNDPWKSGSTHKLGRRVVGRQIRVQSMARDRNGGLMESHNRECDLLFSDWAENYADAKGRLSLGQMQRMTVREASTTGGLLWVEMALEEPGRPLPLAYQLVEYEQLDDSRDRPPDASGTRISGGIETDSIGREVAYWIYDHHPGGVDGGGFGSTRIPAAQVIHFVDPDRPSDGRGVGWQVANTQTHKDLDWFVGNELKKQYLQALWTLIYKRAVETGQGLGLTSSGGVKSGSTTGLRNPLEIVGTGIIQEILEGESVELMESTVKGSEMGPFVDLILKQLAAGAQGMSHVGYTGDYTKTNYSSGKAAGNEDNEIYQIKRDWIGRGVSRGYRTWKTQAIGFELFKNPAIRADHFLDESARFLAHALHFPGRAQTDEDRETTAALKRIFGGLSSWDDEIERLGKSRAKVFEQLKANWEELGEMGVTANLQSFSIALAGAPIGAGVTADPDEAGDD